MAEEQPGRELPQRVRGRGPDRPAHAAPSSSPVLSEELRQRMRAAVTAERSGAATKQDEAPGGEATSPEPVRSVRPRAARREPAARPARTANAGPIAEDEMTEWLETSARPPSSVKPPSAVKPPFAATPSSPVSCQPGSGGFSAACAPVPVPRVARFVAVVLVIGVLAVAGVRYFGRSPAGSPTSAAAARQAAEARAAAASWVAQQVSRDVKVSCDPAMCAALRAHGFPSRELFVVGSNLGGPDQLRRRSRDPGCVRSLFGSSLATAWAPRFSRPSAPGRSSSPSG